MWIKRNLRQYFLVATAFVCGCMAAVAWALDRQAVHEITAEDRMEIVEVMNRYHHYHDYIGPNKGKAMASLFAPDGEMVTPTTKIVGRGAIEERLGNVAGKPLGADEPLNISTSLNPIFKQIAPDRVLVRSKSLNCRQPYRLPGKDISSDGCFMGVFEDVFVKLPEGWRIKKRSWNITVPEIPREFMSGIAP